jgi:hypothetical protein
VTESKGDTRETKMIRGSCLCGGVRYVIDGNVSPIGQCHCSRCRKVSGTASNAVLWTAAGSLTWLEGEEGVRHYVVPDTDHWTSAFCRQCGSPMPHLNNDGKIYFVPAGTLDDDPGLRGIALHIFVDSKAPWDVIADSAPQFAQGMDSKRLDASEEAS